MRALLAFSVLAWSASAGSSSTSLQTRDFNSSSLQALPDCVVNCLEDVPRTYGCQVDSSCFCTDGRITSSYTACVENSCSTHDMLIAQRFEAETCNLPTRNRANVTRGVSWTLLAVVAVFVGLRVISRTSLLDGSGFRWDDFVVVLCFAALVPLNASLEVATQHGLGQDSYNLTTNQLAEVLKWSYIANIMYQSVVMLSKIAVLLLYLRIWTADSTKQTLRAKCWTIIAVVVATVLAFDLASVFQCWPVTFSWTFIAGGAGSCVQREPLLYSFAALNICFNAVVFFLPIHSLLKLEIRWQKKVGVCSVFVLGFVATVTSAIRLQYLVRLRGNIAWDLQYIDMWSAIEASASLICACMPSVTGLVQRCAGADFYPSSSDDLLANGSATTQKQLLRRGNNFYTIDRNSAEAGAAEAQEELFDFDIAPSDSRSIDRRIAGYNPTEVEEITPALGDMSHEDEKFGDIQILKGQDTAGASVPAALDSSRPRSYQFKNQATNMAALLYNSRVGGRPKKVEISHDPPTEPSEARLTYRDENNILHEVTVTDIPRPRAMGPFHSGHGVRPAVLRAITEADSRRTSKFSGEYPSPYTPSTPGFKLDDTPVAEADSPQMISASSQTDFFEPHNLSPINSHSSSPAGRRARPSMSLRSTSTQTDEHSGSLPSRTSSPAGNTLVVSPMVLSRTASSHTEDSEILPSPPLISPHTEGAATTSL